MTEQKIKTHWLQTPNKNYLGHWDLPNGRDMILTIESAQWEEVKNPIINVSAAKRVIRFQEKVKPFICNATNAQSILRSTGQNYMEDCKGYKIKLYLSKYNMPGGEVDCLRVREIPQSELCVKFVSEQERDTILDLIKAAGKDTEEICKIMGVDSINKIPANKFQPMCKRLMELSLVDQEEE